MELLLTEMKKPVGETDLGKLNQNFNIGCEI